MLRACEGAKEEERSGEERSCYQEGRRRQCSRGCYWGARGRFSWWEEHLGRRRPGLQVEDWASAKATVGVGREEGGGRAEAHLPRRAHGKPVPTVSTAAVLGGGSSTSILFPSFGLNISPSSSISTY